MLGLLRWLVLLLVGAIIFWFVCLNAQKISFNFIITSMELPLALPVVASLLAGILIGYVLAMSTYWVDRISAWFSRKPLQ